MTIQCNVMAAFFVVTVWSPLNELSSGSVLSLSCAGSQSTTRVNPPDPTIQLLLKGNVKQRIMAAQKLGRDRNKESVPALVKSLKDPVLSVQSYVAWALGEIRDPSAVEPLVQALEERLDALEEKKLSWEGKSITNIYLALESITGKKYGRNIENWKEYIKRRQKAKE